MLDAALGSLFSGTDSIGRIPTCIGLKGAGRVSPNVAICGSSHSPGAIAGGHLGNHRQRR
jgi:hypothetical protein